MSATSCLLSLRSALRASLMSTLTASLLILTSSSLVSPQAYGFGLFVSAEPIGTSETARVLVVRTETGLRYFIQGKVSVEAETKGFWVIPVPNVTNTEENPPLIRPLEPAVFEELAELTTPRFEGACNDEPNGQVADARQEFSTELIPFTYGYEFNATKLVPPPMDPEGVSALHQFFINEGIEVGEQLNALIDWSYNQNFMLLVVEYEERYLTVGASPAIDVSLALPADTQLRIALKQLESSVMGNSTDLVFYHMSDERTRANFPTRELDISPVSFNSPETTDYLMQFDVVALMQQSQVFITEFVDNVTPSTFTNELLATLRNELLASKLTRLRARFIAAALRNNAESVTLRGEPGGNYSRAHRVEGFMCPEMGGEEAGEMSGEEAGEMGGEEAGEMSGEESGEMGGEEAGEMGGTEAGEMENQAGDDAGEMEGQAGDDTEDEAGESAEMNASSGDDGGCESRSARHFSDLVLALALIALLGLARRAAALRGDAA